VLLLQVKSCFCAVKYTILSRQYKRKLKGKDKTKVYLRTGHEGSQGEYRYRSTFSLTSALGVGG